MVRSCTLIDAAATHDWNASGADGVFLPSHSVTYVAGYYKCASEFFIENRSTMDRTQNRINGKPAFIDEKSIIFSLDLQ